MRMTNPEDQQAIAKSSERLGQTLLEDLPGLNTGEAVIVGEMTRAPSDGESEEAENTGRRQRHRYRRKNEDGNRESKGRDHQTMRASV